VPQCVGCGYDLRHRGADRCPECGRPVDALPRMDVPGAPLLVRLQGAALLEKAVFVAWACLKPSSALGCGADPSDADFAPLVRKVVPTVLLVLLGVTLGVMALGGALGVMTDTWRATGRDLLAYGASNILVGIYDAIFWALLAAGAAAAVIGSMAWRWSRYNVVNCAGFLFVFSVAGEFTRRMAYVLLSEVAALVGGRSGSELFLWAGAGALGYGSFVLLAGRALWGASDHKRTRLLLVLVGIGAMALLLERTAWPAWFRTIHRPLLELLGIW
jgi:hypothetical protein